MSTSTLLLPSSTLRMALWTDAAVSGAAGALQLAGGDALAAALGLPDSLSLYSGVFLLGYAALLVAMARAPRLHAALVALVVFGNLGWALGCVGLPAAGALSPSSLGWAWLLLQALAVVVFAAWEGAGWRASPVARSGHAALHGA
jgi:hypothetical protein